MAQTISKSFTAVGSSAALRVRNGEGVTYSASGTYSATFVLEKSRDGLSWTTTGVGGSVDNATVSGTYYVSSADGGDTLIRWTVTARSSGTLVTTLSDAATILSVPSGKFIVQNKDGTVILQASDSGVTMGGDASIAGTATIGTVAAGSIDPDTKYATATFTATSGDTGTTLTNVTGLTGFPLAAGGVYEYDIDLQTVCTTNSGISVALKLTTATLTANQMAIYTGAAGSMAEARSTTTADATKFVDNKTAAWLRVRLRGTLTVGTAGTVAVQAAQNTSHADATSVYIGSVARFKRIA